MLARKLSGIAVISALVLSAGQAAAQVYAYTYKLKPNNFMREGAILRNGEYIRSNNSAFYLMIVGDGVLELHKGRGPSEDLGLLWSPNPLNPPNAPSKAPMFAIVQADGNFVLYHGTGPSDNRKFEWHTGTGGGTSRALLVLGDNGDLVLYKTATSEGNGVWHSNTVTTVTWPTDGGKRIVNHPANAGLSAEPIDTKAGYRDKYGKLLTKEIGYSDGWELRSDGTLRPAWNTDWCVTVQNDLLLMKCRDNMGSATGWSFNASTGVLGNTKGKGCVGLSGGKSTGPHPPNPGWRSSAQYVAPCPIGDPNTRYSPNEFRLQLAAHPYRDR